MRMAALPMALPQAPTLALDDDPLQPPPKNFAEEQGMHPLQNWIFSTSVYWPLASDAYPHHAVGLEVDWGEGLDKFAALSRAPDAASREQTVRELVLQLDGMEEGSGGPAELLVWKFFIQAIDKHLAEGADLPTLLQLLAGFLRGNTRLFQDAAAYCGCALLEHWAMHQQPPSQAAAAAISEFLGVMAAVVKGLGRAGLHLLKERKECPEPSFHPGCRAAALAYASYTAAKCMQHCTALSLECRDDMLLTTVATAFGLAPLFEAPSGELLSTWQLLAMPLLLSVFKLPTIIFNSVDSKSSAPPVRNITSQFEILARCDLMRGYLEMVAELTGPLKVAVLEPEREDAALQEESILEQLRVTASNMLLLGQFRLQKDRFLECGGVPTLLNYLHTYAELQPSLAWEHPAHDVTEKALASLFQWQRQYEGAKRVLLECGAAAALVAVVGSAPSISEAARHFQGIDQCGTATTGQASQPWTSSPAMAAGTGQQPQPAQQLRQQFGRYRFAAINIALQLMEGLARSSLAGRQALLEADCAGQLIMRMTHLQEGVPLGAVERQSLSPVLEGVVREWTDFAMIVLCRLIASAPSEDAGSKGERKALELTDNVLRRLKDLMTSADLLGLLKWRMQSAHESGTAQSGQKVWLGPYALEQAVLGVASSMVTEYPGYCKGLEQDEEFMAFSEETLMDGSLVTLDSNGLQRHSIVLQILTDIVKHCGSTCTAARLLRVGAPTGTSIVGAALLSFVQTYPRGIAPEAALAGRIQQLPGMKPSLRDMEELLTEIKHTVGVAHAAMELLEALLKQNAPELQQEAGRIKAYMEGLNLKQVVATRGPSDTHGRIKEAGRMARACIKRVDNLAAQGQQMTQQEQQAALEAAEAAAAALLAEEEAAQQAPATKTAKRQRQKAAKQAQQAAAAEQERHEMEERQQREREEGERRAQEKAQRTAEAAATALQAEQQAAQRRAAATAAKRQRQKAAKQAQQEAAGASAAGTAAAFIAAAEPSSSAPASVAQADSLGDVGTPEQAEARGAEASAEDEQEAELQALLSMLTPGAVEPSRPLSTPSATWPPAGGLSSSNSTPLQQAQQHGSAPAPGLASMLRCALSGQQLRDPVIAADGWTYEREVVAAWLAAGETCSPVTGQALSSTALRPNYALRQLLSG